MGILENNAVPDPGLRPSLDTAGREMYQLISRMYPLCRSITGNGVRETLNIVRQQIPIEIKEVPSGTPVFDWVVPKEWNIHGAYLRSPRGDKILDFANSNLHVLNYSVPVHRRIRFDELKEHLFTIPEHPDWIPYRTSYYKEEWGFCLTHSQFLTLQDEEYEVHIDSSLQNGHLTYGELLLPGRTTDEVLISAHVCHPSLCNDNLSGIALSVYLARYLSDRSRRYSYRFLFIPGTIGAITWLALNDANVARIKSGLVLACVGDAGNVTYKKSRQGDAEIDRVAEHVLKHSGDDYNVLEFTPYGYDERQFSSPGFNLSVGSIARTPYGQFPEYHTSADNLDFVKPDKLADSLSKCVSVLNVLDNNERYLNKNPKCEPQLGRRGLYRLFGGRAETKQTEMAMLWVLNFSDGGHTLLDIAERSGLSFQSVKQAADILEQHGLLAPS
jgi:aminopeptidase-like protein